MFKIKTLAKAAALALSASLMTAPAFADDDAREGSARRALPQLDHVFLIVMENHSASEIIGSANAPFINRYANSARQATNYFAVGHPSLPNYLHIVGGSNFGVAGDPTPRWHNDPSLPAGTVTPLSGGGVDLATDASLTGATNGQPIPAASYVAMTIADQLANAGLSWKSYQESLPASGPDRVDYSDGIFSNLSAVTQADVAKLYAVKHNPFPYFAHVQENINPNNGLNNIVAFDGLNGLYADLRAGRAPNLSLIAPNQCHDMHGLGNAGNLCATDATTIQMGDATVKSLVTAIKDSRVWKDGKNAIVVVWDENDFTATPNRVALIVDTNYSVGGVKSTIEYNHHSLLKTLQTGFGLSCLNHSCDATAKVMTDLFGR